MSERKKYLQVCKEAAATGIFLLALIVLWSFLGFGLQGVEGELFSLPVWVIGGVFGTWILGIVGVKILLSAVFRDMDFEEGQNG